jgi:uncharacterized protein YdeI (YjbR/CyaY-like superfamily)
LGRRLKDGRAGGRLGEQEVPTVEIGETLLAPTREVWRTWLEQHHATSAEIWLILGKKNSGVQTVTLDEATEEAVCFGWVDSILKRIDDRTHALRFTPRKPKSVWSQSNVDRVRRLTEQGKMTPAGLAAVEAGRASGQWEAATQREVLLAPPEELEAAFATRPGARDGFARLPDSLKKQFIYWVATAKREETRRRRIDEVIRRSEEALARDARSGAGA